MDIDAEIRDRRPAQWQDETLPARPTSLELEAYTVVWGFDESPSRFSALVWATSPTGAADAVRVRQQHTGMPGIQPLLIIGVVELDSVT